MGAALLLLMMNNLMIKVKETGQMVPAFNKTVSYHPRGVRRCHEELSVGGMLAGTVYLLGKAGGSGVMGCTNCPDGALAL